MSTTCELHETIWSDIANDPDASRDNIEIAEDETLPDDTRDCGRDDTRSLSDETSPEIHDIAGSGLERAANLLLTLCQQTETPRTMWDITGRKSTDD